MLTTAAQVGLTLVFQGGLTPAAQGGPTPAAQEGFAPTAQGGPHFSSSADESPRAGSSAAEYLMVCLQTGTPASHGALYCHGLL